MHHLDSQFSLLTRVFDGLRDVVSRILMVYESCRYCTHITGTKAISVKLTDSSAIRQRRSHGDSGRLEEQQDRRDCDVTSVLRRQLN